MHAGAQDPTTTGRGRGGDRGTAAVEFALMVPLLALFVFGTITFGLILSFKQDVTRAAAEGARAGAVAFPAVGADAEGDAGLPANAWARATEETERAVDGFGRRCGVDMACHVNLHDCATTVAQGTPSDPTSRGDCVTVELVYDYAANPLLAELPILSGFLPDTIQARSVSRLNG